MVTPLVPLIGYDRAVKLAKESVENNITIRQLCQEQLNDLGITQKQLDDALSIETK